MIKTLFFYEVGMNKKKLFKKKQFIKITFCFIFILILNLLAPSLSAISRETNSLFPFVIPWDDSSNNLTNMSSLIEKPAGRSGFVRIKNGHLYAGNNRVRFFGTNFAFDAAFPSHNDAEKIAPHLARLGINCVRFHHIDSRVPPEGLLKKDKVTIDSEQIDKLDYFIYQLKLQGIYTDLNIHVGRTYPYMQTWTNMPSFFKGIDLFYPPMIQMQKDYAKDLLTHYNPYTKNKYINEPAIVFLEINNEDSLIHEWSCRTILNDSTPEIYIAELKKQWNDWLGQKYKLKPNEKPKCNNIIRKNEFKNYTLKEQQDWLDFLYFTENNYWTSMYNYIKNDLNSQSLIIGSQNYASPYLIQAKMDVLDNHAYWQHPIFPHKPWDKNDSIVNNVSMAGMPGGAKISKLAMSRVVGKPFIVTEYNHCYPNKYSSEAFLLLSAYAALQDWDGIFSFEYTNSSDWDIQKIKGWFDIDQNPTMLVTFAPSAAMFIRNDVSTSVIRQNVYASYDQIRDSIRNYGSYIYADTFRMLPETALKYPVGLTLNPTEATELKNDTKDNVKIKSITNELLWDSTANQRVVTINTAMSKAVIGSIAQKVFVLNDVNINFCSNMQNWAAVSLTKFGDTGFNSKGNILITATGYLQNTNMKWKDSAKTSVIDWGNAPSLVEGISADIILPVKSTKINAWALDSRGNRKTKLKLKNHKGKTIVSIGPKYKTLWYEVQIK